MLKINNLPTNPKTLFLRNIEIMLIYFDLLKSNDLDFFKTQVAPIILDLLERYKFSCEDENHEGLRNQYIGNCIALRGIMNKLSNH